MVWVAAPAAGTARVFSADVALTFAECSTYTFETLQTLHSHGASASLKEGHTAKRVQVPRGFFVKRRVQHTSSPSLFRFETRRANFRYIVQVISENKEKSKFGQNLIELARKTADPFTSSAEDRRDQALNKTINRGDSSETELEDRRQAAKGSGQVKGSGLQPKATRLVFDLPKRRISLRDWKKTFSEILDNGSKNFEATRLAPLPPFTGSLIALLGFLLIFGVLLDKWIGRVTRVAPVSNTGALATESSDRLEAPTGISIFLEKDLKRKESVEWVNMVLGKLWKVYRLGLENWLCDLLQPLIDNLQKPGYVRRVEIDQFYLGDEPLGIRSVERRASRRVNDLQYHIGLRYSGSARMLLLLRLTVGFIPITIPVGVRGLDIDGEMWVKLRLVPSEPWVGAATWAFVALPKIKLVLSPFRIFNLMAIPFLSTFLTKLLTQDLPQLFVRPNKNVVDFMKGEAAGPLPKDFKGATLDGNVGFCGELSATLVEARKLSYLPFGRPDPYVILTLGDQAIRSKKNSQTSVIGPPGSPIWNQDFRLLVVDPKTQRLGVRVRDYFGLSSFTIGYGEMELNALRDTVPDDRVVTLRGSYGPFLQRFAGEISLRLTYTAYVDDDEHEHADTPLHPSHSHASDLDHPSPLSTINKVEHNATESVIGTESTDFNNKAHEDLWFAKSLAKETGNNGDLKASTSVGNKVGNQERNIAGVQTDESVELDGSE